MADPGHSWAIRANATGQFSVFRDPEAQGLLEVFQGSPGGEAAGLYAIHKKGCDAADEREVRMADLRAETL